MLTQKRIWVASISHSTGAHEGSKESYVKIQNLCYTYNLFSAISLRNFLEMIMLIS